MDFGLARATGHQPITVAKTLVGSIYYASPEQVWGHTLDNRSDVYALGVVLYEMVTGQRPFTGRSLPELTQAIVSGTLLPPDVYNKELSPDLEKIILTAMARDRDQRYEDASLMARDLRALQLKLLPTIAPSLSAAQPHLPSRDHMVVQPPRRPQVQRPHYQSIVPESFVSNTHVQPSSTASPARGLSHRSNTHAFDGPTVPLASPIAIPASAPSGECKTVLLSSFKRKCTVWEQLQRLFRPSSR